MKSHADRPSPQPEALAEIAFCEEVLLKGGASVLSETLRGVEQQHSYQKYPSGEVFDPQSGAQWFYHSHGTPLGSSEHGHFHCFVRPNGAQGSVHHLCAIGVDRYGKLISLFTVNHWVVDDDWLPATPTIALLPRFDVHMPHPNYLVNRWLTAVMSAYEEDIKRLIVARDARLEAAAKSGLSDPKSDRSLEVTSALDLTLA